MVSWDRSICRYTSLGIYQCRQVCIDVGLDWCRQIPYLRDAQQGLASLRCCCSSWPRPETSLPRPRCTQWHRFWARRVSCWQRYRLLGPRTGTPRWLWRPCRKLVSSRHRSPLFQTRMTSATGATRSTGRSTRNFRARWCRQCLVRLPRRWRQCRQQRRTQRRPR